MSESEREARLFLLLLCVGGVCWVSVGMLGMASMRLSCRVAASSSCRSLYRTALSRFD